MGAPGGGEFALEGLLEERLAIDAELPPRPPQALLPEVQLAEQFLDLRDDPLLLVEGWEGDREIFELRSVDVCLADVLRNDTFDLGFTGRAVQIERKPFGQSAL